MFYVLAGIVLANLALVTFLIVKLLSATSARADALAVIATLTVRAERAEFELAATTKELATERTRSKALEAYVQEIQESQNADLAADDVVTRLRRLLALQGDPSAPGDPLPTIAEPAVPPLVAPAGVHEPGPDELLRPE